MVLYSGILIGPSYNIACFMMGVQHASDRLKIYISGPRSRATHWKQTVLYLEDVLTICQGEAIVGSMSVAPNKKNPRDVDIMLKYSLNGRRSVVSRIQHYKMR